MLSAAKVEHWEALKSRAKQVLDDVGHIWLGAVASDFLEASRLMAHLANPASHKHSLGSSMFSASKHTDSYSSLCAHFSKVKEVTKTCKVAHLDLDNARCS